MEDNGIIYDDMKDMKDLRTKTSNEEGVVKFKKGFLGGIKERDVEEYISSLTEQFHHAESAYKNRIDEFAIHTEMLIKERDDALSQIQKKSVEIRDAKTEISAMKTEQDKLLQENAELKKKLNETEMAEAERIRKEESGMSIVRENELLKKELNEISQSRDKLAAEKAVIKKQLDESDGLLAASLKEKNELKMDVSTIRSLVRQSEMNKNLKLSEYTEKQVYAMDQTTRNLKEMIQTFESMKNEVYELFSELKESKGIDSIPGTSLSDAENVQDET